MAHFKGTIQGNKRKVSCTGTKKSKLIAKLNGSNIGVEISCLIGLEGEDLILIYKTSGSRGKTSELICFIHEGGEINYV